MWEYVNDSTYHFIVGDYQDGTWKQTYLKTQFKAKKIRAKEALYEQLKTKLSGEWTSKAWSGLLNESWMINDQGHLVQQANYLENGKIVYEASNKMELVNGELILFTVIKNGNPKIFKATAFSNDRIVFENSDYQNPNKVVYEFSPTQGFQRTISGMENGKATTYTFMFKPIQ